MDNEQNQNMEQIGGEPVKDAAAVNEAFANVFGADDGKPTKIKAKVKDEDEDLEDDAAEDEGLEERENGDSEEADDDSDDDDIDGGETDDDEDEDEDGVEDDEDDEDEDDPIDQIDPALLSIAELTGMSREKVTNLFKADPKGTVKALEALADSFTSTSQAFASVQSKDRATSAGNAPSLTAGFDKLFQNMDKLSETHGQEFVDNIMKPLKTEVLEPLKQVYAFMQEQRQQDLIRRVDRHYDTLATGAFEAFYGKSGEPLSKRQQANREQVAEWADRISVGANAQGKDISPEEALTRAHVIVTANLRNSTALKEVQSKVKKRAKGLSVKPSSRTQRSAELPRSETKAMAAYAAKLSELGLND